MEHQERLSDLDGLFFFIKRSPQTGALSLPSAAVFLSQEFVFDIVKFACGIVFARLMRDALDAAAADSDDRAAVKARLITGGLSDLHRVGQTDAVPDNGKVVHMLMTADDVLHISGFFEDGE